LLFVVIHPKQETVHRLIVGRIINVQVLIIVLQYKNSSTATKPNLSFNVSILLTNQEPLDAGHSGREAKNTVERASPTKRQKYPLR
jgi:hypothetical protein